jgi:hypothetical protein
MVLLIGPVVLLGVLPARPLVSAVWPGPIEELVLPDGRWRLEPVSWQSSFSRNNALRARTRPYSVIEVQLHDGSRERGYLISQNPGADGQLKLQTGPGQHKVLPLSTTRFRFYPNDMFLRERLRLALSRLQDRLPLKQMPSPEESLEPR